MSLQDIFTANMRKYRKQAHFTQEKLAELCGTDPCYIGQIENGRRFPSLPYIERISSALKVPPHELFFDAARPNDGAANSNNKKEDLKNTLISRVSKEIDSVIEAVEFL
jgi:transcriptional regulator with XRE-family HTH domain